MAESVDNGGNGVDHPEAYVYDGQNLILKFGNDSGSTLGMGDIKSYFLYGPAVDMVLAEEISRPRNFRIGFRNPIVRPPLSRAENIFSLLTLCTVATSESKIIFD